MTWLQDHGDDEIPVKLIDLLCLVARLEQTAAGTDLVSVTHERIWTCDLPRLKAYLPPEAISELG